MTLVDASKEESSLKHLLGDIEAVGLEVPATDMVVPDPLPCSAPGCLYTTPENLPNFATITTHLQLHTQAAHAAAAPGQGFRQSSKVDKRPRPEAALDMTEHEFKFYQSEWNLYKRATKISGQTLVDELWTTMSPDLKKLAFDQGDVESLTTEEQMMARIKSLAVSVLHTAIHTVSLHEAQQLPEESTKTFAARVRGIASDCELQKKCSCGEIVSYTEETVYHVVLAGLRDRELLERCTTQALMKNITDISSLVAYCSAEESGKLGTLGTVGGVRSSYKKQKQGVRPGNQNKPGPSMTQTGKCRYCGEGPHSSNTSEARSKECRAYGVTCRNCDVKSHLAKVCRAKTKKVSAAVTVLEETEDNPENSLSEFAFYGLEHFKTQNRFAVLKDPAPDSILPGTRVPCRRPVIQPRPTSLPSPPFSKSPTTPFSTALPSSPTSPPTHRRRKKGGKVTRGLTHHGIKHPIEGSYHGVVEGLVGPGTSTAKFGLEKDLAAASAEDKQPGVAGLGTNTMKSELADDLAVAAAGSNKPVKVPLCHMEYTYEKGWVENRLLNIRHLYGIWTGLTPYRPRLDTLSEYPEP